MGRQYKLEEMIQKCVVAMSDPNTFYAQDFVNYKGICPDAQVPYTEVVASFLCENLTEYISGIQPVSRDSSYFMPTHCGQYDPKSNREEELIAMQMFNASQNGMQYAGIGRIIDYQTPLKGKQTDKAGKIDLLAYDGDTLRLLELKRQKTNETMLRCVLEGFTYLMTVNTSRLIENFNEHGADISQDCAVKASPLVFLDSRPHLDYMNCSPKLKELMRLLDSEPFFLRKNGDNFEVAL